VKGKQWFGVKKYNLICRYFLLNRSAKFIKELEEEPEKLLRKRKKYEKQISSLRIKDGFITKI